MQKICFWEKMWYQINNLLHVLTLEIKNVCRKAFFLVLPWPTRRIRPNQSHSHTGIDKINLISVVKSSSNYIPFVLCHIFYLFLSQDQFITDLKKLK